MKTALNIMMILAITLIGSVDNLPAAPAIGIEQKLGAQVPMDLKFTNSDGKVYSLKEIIKKPTVLSLVYYHCPGICSPLLTGEASVIDQVKDLKFGENYQAVTISFDPSETPQRAAQWRNNYITTMKSRVTPESWRFMVGDSASIRALTNAVGFYYKPEGDDDFTHAATLIMLTPDGKVSRYLPGTSYLDTDFKMGIILASEGKSMPFAAKVIEFCYSYDPKSGNIIFNFNKIGGALIVLGASVFITILLIRGKKNEGEKLRKKKIEEAESNEKNNKGDDNV
ncbi:MAG: SCO family protein [Chloroflexota bacterium]